MALIPENETHRYQIIAGKKGRDDGHKFEEMLANEINSLRPHNLKRSIGNSIHLFRGNPANILLDYILSREGWSATRIDDFEAIWLGGLATTKDCYVLMDDGQIINKCKSDVLIRFTIAQNDFWKGISVKTCSKKTPTNDQMYFTTARAFCSLLQNNNIPVSTNASDGLSMFCGDNGYRPVDILDSREIEERVSDPDRFYWEEMPKSAQREWEALLSKYQDDITRLLFQKAYTNDPFPPDYLLHQTVKFDQFEECPMALFSIDEIVDYSSNYGGFSLKPYGIHKGRFKADSNTHYAPRFGFIQFQRGGQKQHPTQLQFNLKSGYFNHLK